MLESIAIRISIWNEWRKHNINSKFHKLLVLLGLVYSPTFTYFYQITDGVKKCNAISYTYEDRYDDDEAISRVTIQEVEKDVTC